MRLSLTFCLLVASTAIGDETFLDAKPNLDPSPDCKAAVDSALNGLKEIIPLRDISDDLEKKSFLQETFLKKHGPTLDHICMAKDSRKAALQYIVDEIYRECGEVEDTSEQIVRKTMMRTKQQIAALDAICYLERDEKGSLQFVVLKNPWVFAAFQDGLSKAEPNDRDFHCTKGNQHVLGTINNVVVLQEVVAFAEKKCIHEFPKFVQGLKSATGAPHPKEQEEWEGKHKMSGEMLNNEIDTWRRRLEFTTTEWKRRFQKTETELEAEVKELHDTITEQATRLKNSISEMEWLRGNLVDEMIKQKASANERDDALLKVESHRTLLVNEVIKQKDSAKERDDALLKVQKYQGLLADADVTVQKYQSLWADAESRLDNAFSRNDPKNSATSTSIPAISGFLSLAFLASQY